MPYDPKAVDALLAAACSRLLNAGALINQMRVLHAQGREEDYWRVAIDLGTHLTVGGDALTEAHRLMLRDVPVFVAGKGGLPN
jgi:hypothetical protein